MTKNKVFKIDETKIGGAASLGELVSHGHPAIEALTLWAKNKEEACYDSVHTLMTNPGVKNETIFYNLGEARSVKRDLLEFLKNCQRAYELRKNNKEEA